MGQNKVTSEWQKAVLFILFIIGVGLHYYCGSFSKAIFVLPDELRYYALARSINDGSGLMLRDWNVDFQKVAYSLLIAPTFSISDSFVRVRLITLLNSIVMMSSALPVLLICREMRLKFREQLWIMLLLMAWPELVFSVTFMSEVLLYPISFWWIYVWIKYENSHSKVFAGILGVLCYIGYLDKEVFATYFLLFIVVELYGIFRSIHSEKKKCPEKVIGTGVFLLTFFVLFIGAKLTVFRGMGNSYDQQSIDVILNLHNFLYMLYAFYYHIISILVVCFGVIVFFTAVHYKDVSLELKRLYSFVSLNIIGTCAVIAYTISVREDLDKAIPRVHFRYLGPSLFLFILIFIVAIKQIHEKENVPKRKKTIFALMAVLAIFCVFTFKGFLSLGSAVDGFVVDAYKVFEYNIAVLVKSSWVSEIIMIIGITAVGFIILMCIELLGYNKRISCICALLLLVLLFDKYRSYLKIYAEYKAPKDLVKEVIALDEFLEEQQYDKTVLYLTSKLDYDMLERCMDTYIDQNHGFYYVDELMLSDKYGNNGIENVSGMTMIGSIWDYDYHQKYGVSEINYVVVDCEGIDQKIEGLTLIPELSNEYFEVFINDEPATLEVVYE